MGDLLAGVRTRLHIVLQGSALPLWAVDRGVANRLCLHGGASCWRLRLIRVDGGDIGHSVKIDGLFEEVLGQAVRYCAGLV